jgi:hypothetical protein
VQHGWEVIIACKILAKIPEGRRQQWRCKDDIKIYIKE